MRSVSVKELQNDLRRYLDEACAGQEVLIKERNKPAVKLAPLSANGHPAAQPTKPAPKKPRSKPTSKRPAPKKARDYLTVQELEAHVAQMIAEGKMRAPEIKPSAELWEEFFEEPLADFGDLDVVGFISEDRDED